MFSIYFYVVILTSIMQIERVESKDKTIVATCVLNTGNEQSGVGGSISFSQSSKNGAVHITGTVTGLTPNSKHGFHTHEKMPGDGTNPCEATGAHFNPFKKDHGGPKDKIRHVGDLGNIKANNMGVAVLDFYDEVISLRGEKSILRRSCVVHSNEDDLGKGGKPLSKINGDAGSKIACGEVEVDHGK